MPETKRIPPDFHGDAAVLVVDDKPANLEVVEGYLRESGFTTLVARSGESALKRIRYKRPDLILLDIMMPGLDGFETCRRLKSHENTRDIPVIFMTALIDIEHKVRGFSAGAVDYIVKPVQKEELLARVGTHLQLHRYQTNLEKEVRIRTAELEERMTELATEIAERKQAQEELNRARNYISNIINSMPSVLIGVDTAGKVTQWNRTAEQTTGIAAPAAHGKALPDVFPRMAGDMKKIFESIRTRETKQERKRPRLLENGTLYEDVTIYPLVANGVDGAVIRVDDVTDKVRMEEMVIQSEKMLSVGGLAAGMAHEVNNPVAAMMQTANVMANRLGENLDIPANRKAAEAAGTTMEAVVKFMEARGIPRMIGAINESGSRVTAIVDNMLSFARKSDSRISSCFLPDLFDKALELAATDYDLKKRFDFRNIEIQKEHENNVPPVPCEGAKIQQVLLNILRNGAQAMQAAETGNPRFIVRTRFEKERETVCMEIEDNGPGMDDSTRKRVFEPFFTTKPVGTGTGLGLSVSYFIITENHGGEMAVESRPGSGTKFIIRLPLKR